jgi:hypothetical protein
MVTRKLAFAKQEHAPRFTFKLARRHNSSQGFRTAETSAANEPAQGLATHKGAMRHLGIFMTGPAVRCTVAGLSVVAANKCDPVAVSDFVAVVAK